MNIQNIYIQICREFHGISEYIITFLKMLIYSYDMLKIPSLTSFFQGEISQTLECINVQMNKERWQSKELFLSETFFVAAGWNVLWGWLWSCSTVSYSLYPFRRLSLVRILKIILSIFVLDKILLKLIFKKLIFIIFSVKKQKNTLIQWAITFGNLLWKKTFFNIS